MIARAIDGSRAHAVPGVTGPDGAVVVGKWVKLPGGVVLLDLGMPRLDGIRVIEALRGWTTAPIIVVSGRTGRTGWADKVEALDAGADDYITKPFQIDELLARLRALARRAAKHSTTPLVVFGDVQVDLSAKTVTRAGSSVHLTPTEWRMLKFLANNPGSLVTRQTLLKEIWESEQVSDSGYLRLYMSQLRKKLEADPSHPRHLITEQGMGYRLITD